MMGDSSTDARTLRLDGVSTPLLSIPVCMKPSTNARSRMMKADTMLKQMPLMADIANTAVFLASDMAGKITGVTVDVTAGTTAGLNYKVESRGEHRPTFGSNINEQLAGK